MTTNLVKKEWDYSLHAEFYQYRPNYAPKAIDMLVEYVRPSQGTINVADIGAGTGNLSVMLAERGLKVTAVEPNDPMREIGEKRTADTTIHWVKAEGTHTRLPNKSYDWVTFGSSFNVIDREAGLRETARLLVSGGYFTCMWNHRNLHDPIQNQAEEIILKYVPDYDRGVRREDQRPIIENSPLFKNIFYLEMDFEFEQTIETYLNAWKSVKNRYWDLSTQEGKTLFDKIQRDMVQELPTTFSIQYTTRAWTAEKNS